MEEEEKEIVLQAAPVSGPIERVLRFVEPADENMVREAEELWRKGRRLFLLRGERARVETLAGLFRANFPELRVNADADGTAARSSAAYFYAGMDDDTLAKTLISHVEDGGAAIVAPRGPRHSSLMPLFLISIPKSGTHLLYELARALGYRDGIICPAVPAERTWYCIEYSNSHTRATDFLIDTTRRSAFGNKHHPFFRSPALFIYRNPLDILVSEANWFGSIENSPVSGYLQGLSFADRLTQLIDDPWLLGTIRDRVGAFIPWLSFSNVIPLSFEELVGAKGGADDTTQLDLVWSIQLKLQVDGSPQAVAHKLFNPDSPTFAEGQVGGWRRHATPDAKERLARLPRDFLQIYGYADCAEERASAIPARAAEFRRRPLTVSDVDFDRTPILVETDYLEHNVVQVGRRFYAVPQAAGPVALDRADLDRIRGIVQGKSINEVKAGVLRNWLRSGLLRR